MVVEVVMLLAVFLYMSISVSEESIASTFRVNINRSPHHTTLQPRIQRSVFAAVRASNRTSWSLVHWERDCRATGRWTVGQFERQHGNILKWTSFVMEREAASLTWRDGFQLWLMRIHGHSSCKERRLSKTAIYYFIYSNFCIMLQQSENVKPFRYCHAGAKEKRKYSSYSFLTSVLDGGE
jgi:hypothetical protein